jgi:hypothetical protein
MTSEINIEVRVSDDTLERIHFLAEADGVSLEEAAEKLLADQAEAEAGLRRGPYLRRYMHR